MQRILENLKPEKLFYYFEEVSKIPRNSHEEQQISDYLMKFALDHGWAARRSSCATITATVWAIACPTARRAR